MESEFFLDSRGGENKYFFALTFFSPSDSGVFSSYGDELCNFSRLVAGVPPPLRASFLALQ